MAKYDPNIHHRRSIRLRGYDYAQPGAYFVTLVAYQRELLFGEILDGAMQLSQAGEIVSAAWLRLAAFFPIWLDEWVIMPNHLHGIVCWGEASAAGVIGISWPKPADASPLRRSRLYPI